MKNDKGEGMGRLKIEGGLLTFFPRKGDLIKGGGMYLRWGGLIEDLWYRHSTAMQASENLW